MSVWQVSWLATLTQATIHAPTQVPSAHDSAGGDSSPRSAPVKLTVQSASAAAWFAVFDKVLQERSLNADAGRLLEQYSSQQRHHEQPRRSLDHARSTPPSVSNRHMVRRHLMLLV